MKNLASFFTRTTAVFARQFPSSFPFVLFLSFSSMLFLTFFILSCSLLLPPSSLKPFYPFICLYILNFPHTQSSSKEFLIMFTVNEKWVSISSVFRNELKSTIMLKKAVFFSENKHNLSSKIDISLQVKYLLKIKFFFSLFDKQHLKTQCN